MLERLRHTNIIRYYGVESSEEEMGIIMELAEGGSLADLIKERGAPGVEAEGVKKTEVREILEQMANALDYMHGQGIVHRDIKAENIVRSHAPGSGPLRIKVVDFGVAAAMSTARGSVLQSLASGAGTRPYFAPERENQLAYGVMADMWALGCVVIEMLTGFAPWRGKQQPQIMMSVAGKRQAPPGDIAHLAPAPAATNLPELARSASAAHVRRAPPSQPEILRGDERVADEEDAGDAEDGGEHRIIYGRRSASACGMSTRGG